MDRNWKFRISIVYAKEEVSIKETLIKIRYVREVLFIIYRDFLDTPYFRIAIIEFRSRFVQEEVHSTITRNSNANRLLENKTMTPIKKI